MIISFFPFYNSVAYKFVRKITVNTAAFDDKGHMIKLYLA